MPSTGSRHGGGGEAMTGESGRATSKAPRLPSRPRHDDHDEHSDDDQDPQEPAHHRVNLDVGARCGYDPISMPSLLTSGLLLM